MKPAKAPPAQTQLLRAKLADLAATFPFDDRRQHALNKIAWHGPKTLGGRFLDIGCGPGNGVIAALQHGYEMAIGIDRDLREFSAFTMAIDDLCTVYEVEASRALIIEADISVLNFQPWAFDCILMLDSIEHVPDVTSFIEFASRHLAPGGHLIIDTSPLYYSISGSHLFNHFDPTQLPWVHLRRDFENLLAARGVDDWSFQRFSELNKATHDDIVAAAEAAGLHVIEEHRGKETPEAAALLAEHESALCLDGIRREWLFEDWILLVCQRS